MNTRVEMYDITLAEAIGGVIDKVMECHPKLKKAEAKKLVINSMLYNCVIADICDQVDFLLGESEEEDY